MPMSTDIQLPKSYQAKFPDCCVVCEKNSPGSYARIVSSTVRWWTWLTFHSGGIYTVKVPACPVCAWKLQLSRLFDFIFLGVIALGAIWYVWPHFKELVPKGLRFWAQGAVALIVILPKFVYDLYHPAAFDVLAEARTVTYQFRSPFYAALFTGYNLKEVTRVNPGYSLSGDASTTDEHESSQ